APCPRSFHLSLPPRAPPSFPTRRSSDLEDDLEIVAVAASGTEAVAAASKYAPDVAVLDLQMPGLDGIEVAAELASSLPACGVVIVTSHGRPGYLKRALETGVRAFLPKTTSARVLADV